MADTIFTKIIKGEIPCHKVHEDENSFAFMDINPIQPGMTVVVSREQVDHVWDLTDEQYLGLMKTVKKVSQKLRATFPNKKRVAIIVEGFEVPHAHVKVFPVDSEKDVRNIPIAAEPDHDKLAEMAKKLAF